MTTAPSLRLGLAAIASCATAAGLYAIIRSAQALLYRDADPALVIWSPHAGFFWRSLTSGYVGTMIGFVTYLAAARDADRTARVLSAGVVVALLLITAQGILVP